MSAGPQPIVGREPELRRVDEFLDAIQAGPIALVLEGEVGIGKTASTDGPSPGPLAR
jgi:Cdc6-like AAA superfamily ATPase